MPTQQQIQAITRLIAAGLVTWLMQRGLSQTDGQVVLPMIEELLSAIIGIGTFAWTWWSHKPSTLKATAEKLTEQGK